MNRSLNPFARFALWHRQPAASAKLYEAIVAQARLPVFYQAVGVPDTLAGRHAVLALHLFAVLHRLRGEPGDASLLAQELTDIFTKDMETVLRELGVGDLAVPKKVRDLAAKSAGLLQTYELAYGQGPNEFAAAIAASLPLEGEEADAAAAPLASYIRKVVDDLAAQYLGRLTSGSIILPDISYRFGTGLR